MKEKKQMKVSLKIAIIIAVVSLILITIIGVGAFTIIKEKTENKNKTEESEQPNNVIDEINYALTVDDLSKYKNSKYPVTNTVKIDKSGEYYVWKGDYAGEYDLQFLKFSAESFKEANKKVNSNEPSIKILKNSVMNGK